MPPYCLHHSRWHRPCKWYRLLWCAAREIDGRPYAHNVGWSTVLEIIRKQFLRVRAIENQEMADERIPAADRAHHCIICGKMLYERLVIPDEKVCIECGKTILLARSSANRKRCEDCRKKRARMNSRAYTRRKRVEVAERVE